jgi:hypothetical protein
MTADLVGLSACNTAASGKADAGSRCLAWQRPSFGLAQRACW